MKLAGFFKNEAAGGIVMLAAAGLAMVLANSGAENLYAQAVEGKHLVNDWMMVIFFFVVACELKLELTAGMLRTKQQRIFPLVAAIGGMVVPAGIYFAFNYGQPDQLHGWAIPASTDIAFALSVLLIFGRHMPPAAKILLLAIAIFDDLGAIIIIALFYSSHLDYSHLWMAVCLVMIMYMVRCRRNSQYIIILAGGVLAWLLHEGGIHTTIAGVITGLILPVDKQKSVLHYFHPLSSFVVVPLFAFVNSGLVLAGISRADMSDSVTLGIIVGLFAGKQLGIFAASWGLVKSGLAGLPEGLKWRHVYIVSVIAGIGFTMSLFIGGLAFASEAAHSKVMLGVISASLLAAMVGIMLLRREKKFV